MGSLLQYSSHTTTPDDVYTHDNVDDHDVMMFKITWLWFKFYTVSWTKQFNTQWLGLPTHNNWLTDALSSHKF